MENGESTQEIHRQSQLPDQSRRSFLQTAVSFGVAQCLGVHAASAEMPKKDDTELGSDVVRTVSEKLKKEISQGDEVLRSVFQEGTKLDDMVGCYAIEETLTREQLIQVMNTLPVGTHHIEYWIGRDASGRYPYAALRCTVRDSGGKRDVSIRWDVAPSYTIPIGLVGGKKCLSTPAQEHPGASYQRLLERGFRR